MANAGADLNEEYSFYDHALFYTMGLDLDMFSELLDNGINPDTRNFSGDTPLTFSAMNSIYAPYAQKLIEAGANLNDQKINVFNNGQE